MSNLVPESVPELFVATTPRLHPDIPVLNLDHEHPSHRVVEVIQTTKGYGETVVRDGEFVLVTGPSLTTHHPVPKESYDLLLWVGRQESGSDLTLPWGEDHILSLARNREFWAKVEDWVSLQRREKPTLRFFLLLGHPLNHPQLTHDLKNTQLYHMGMQSLPSIHAHLTALINKDEIPKGQLHPFDPENKTHVFLLSTFLTTGEQSLDNFNGAFEPLNANRRTFTSSFRLGQETLTINRPFLGFGSFGEAFRVAVDLQQAVKDLWLAHAVDLSVEHIPLALGAFQLFLKQSCVPNMTLISLSEHDQHIIGVDKDINAAVLPFSLTNPQSLLDGVLLDRKME